MPITYRDYDCEDYEEYPETVDCKRCFKQYSCDPIDDNYRTSLCYYCFEDSLEEHEDNRRRRIAERNEY